MILRLSQKLNTKTKAGKLNEMPMSAMGYGNPGEQFKKLEA